jgi:hypothetical protein
MGQVSVFSPVDNFLISNYILFQGRNIDSNELAHSRSFRHQVGFIVICYSTKHIFGRWELIEKMNELISANITPVIPLRGSISASGGSWKLSRERAPHS